MPEALSHHDIYEAALDDELFNTLPNRLAREIDVPSTIFIWLHPGDYREIAAGTQAEANLDYNSFEGHDPWLAHGTDDKIGMGAFRLSNYVSPQELEKSEMYSEFIKKNRLDRYWCLGLMQSTRDGRVATAFHKGKTAGDFTDTEIGLINRHVEDLGRLHEIRRELHRASIRKIAAVDRSLLDDAPIFELDQQGRLLQMNGKAERLFKLHPLLAIDSKRTLRVRGTGKNAFHFAAAKATGVSKSEGSAMDLAQTRATDGRIIPKLRLNFLPRTEGGRKVLVIATTECADGMQNFFDSPQEKILLTPRERDVLHGFIRGLKRDQLSHDLNLAMPTIDLHSANLRRKLGARTIAEAVAIALKHGLV
ncbi:MULTISPECIES: LuxR C-terminal-related transcriptional regulator [Pacificibacter]|uniref:LuxR C-terminal-related transcriptional regulator n=1 Tax=Pacificibacter TaxID=1042323 RepID=UPI001C09E119|nr:LuxR C-terminal-related transcriptional regulator [Pacificibacter sp. 1_MG-2023]MBU2934563.1 LuxR C-terminal-related transcriptional regulator [Pacificibacter marinus]MDO6617290.1 LuxR C-terminal-related transcriptional regulator [Pacificibacter sp. 1_MG-2023]